VLVASGSGPVFVFCGFCFAVGWLVGLFGHCVGRYAFLTGGSALQPNAWPLFFVLLFLATMSCTVFCRSLDLFLLSFNSHTQDRAFEQNRPHSRKKKEDMHQDEV
jgi:CBS domain containing-hemolysin-like protein